MRISLFFYERNHIISHLDFVSALAVVFCGKKKNTPKLQKKRRKKNTHKMTKGTKKKRGYVWLAQRSYV